MKGGDEGGGGRDREGEHSKVEEGRREEEKGRRLKRRQATCSERSFKSAKKLSYPAVERSSSPLILSFVICKVESANKDKDGEREEKSDYLEDDEGLAREGAVAAVLNLQFHCAAIRGDLKSLEGEGPGRPCCRESVVGVSSNEWQATLERR